MFPLVHHGTLEYAPRLVDQLHCPFHDLAGAAAAVIGQDETAGVVADQPGGDGQRDLGLRLPAVPPRIAPTTLTGLATPRGDIAAVPVALRGTGSSVS